MIFPISYVTCFLINKETDQVLLIRKLKPEWQYGKMNGIGGKIEPGETPVQAAVREIEEKIGIQVPETRLMYFAYMEAPQKWINHCFYAELDPRVWRSAYSRESEQVCGLDIEECLISSLDDQNRVDTHFIGDLSILTVAIAYARTHPEFKAISIWYTE